MGVKLVFGYLGALAYKDSTNLFDDLFFSKSTPFVLLVATFVYTVFVVLPVVVRSSLMAKYFIYIGGMCEVPCNYLFGVILPWVLGAIINHLQLYAYLINWTALLCCLYVQFVCPMFMWSKSVKESKIYENNFKSSLQMIFEGDKPTKDKQAEIYLATPKDHENSKRRSDGAPSSYSQSLHRDKGLSTSKYLLNDEEDDRMSQLSEMFYPH